MVAEVVNELRDIFYDCDEQLDIRYSVDNVEPRPRCPRVRVRWCGQHDEDDDGYADEGPARDAEHEARRSRAGSALESPNAGKEILCSQHGAYDHCMRGKDDVIDCDARGVAMVAKCILVTDGL